MMSWHIMNIDQLSMQGDFNFRIIANCAITIDTMTVWSSRFQQSIDEFLVLNSDRPSFVRTGFWRPSYVNVSSGT